MSKSCDSLDEVYRCSTVHTYVYTKFDDPHLFPIKISPPLLLFVSINIARLALWRRRFRVSRAATNRFPNKLQRENVS